eukprot:TRINITY_DN14060_c0_g1_i1.p1 TRINITY_DN14060_c0_g1~~TRINITY_DN14060_c0_g1_i1.p1  ORF type:complete len:248 (+),score=54.36 TRINITY_DN14060_c0_g1_i1:147-890(+)
MQATNNTDRFTEIEKSNRLLLERITDIQTSKRKPESAPRSNPYRRSLNISFRKREISKITSENYALLKRLQEKKSHYDASQLKKEYKRTKKLLCNISEYPYRIGSCVRSPKRLVRPPAERVSLPHVNLRKNKRFANCNFLLLLVACTRGSSIEAVTQPRREVICRKRRVLGNEGYDVEIELIRGKIVITARSARSIISVSIPEEKSREIEQAFKGDWELLVSKLFVVDSKLTIVAPAKEEIDQSNVE